MTTMTSPSIRTYSDLIRLPTFMKRFEYLRLNGQVGSETFGFDRYLNQQFYHSREWKTVRDYVITRDLGRDLAKDGYEIHGKIYIHHMNPITQTDIVRSRASMVDPEFLICVSHNTHSCGYADTEEFAKALAEYRRREGQR